MLSNTMRVVRLGTVFLLVLSVLISGTVGALQAQEIGIGDDDDIGLFENDTVGLFGEGGVFSAENEALFGGEDEELFEDDPGFGVEDGDIESLGEEEEIDPFANDPGFGVEDDGFGEDALFGEGGAFGAENEALFGEGDDFLDDEERLFGEEGAFGAENEALFGDEDEGFLGEEEEGILGDEEGTLFGDDESVLGDEEQVTALGDFAEDPEAFENETLTIEDEFGRAFGQRVFTLGTGDEEVLVVTAEQEGFDPGLFRTGARLRTFGEAGIFDADTFEQEFGLRASPAFEREFAGRPFISVSPTDLEVVE